ncbi:F0F1 ATP synthase subunit gamma [uncultured Bacteroides sp.]|uniref:F0F1 ATP synthase subunit gamma n=1 Tax=uncultured Bacteroides sp. TaxID=162156 RepID=UPI002AA7CFD2|nr:F0F1 ATP synthase subunit gamma [uncultured Bacteroides sp.]
MASLKEIKSRIGSVRSTRQITSAMKMVASAKLHKAQGAIESMLPYQTKLNAILTNLLSTYSTVESPYVVKRPVNRVAIVVFSSNSSLCGAFNANVAKQLAQKIESYAGLGQENILIFPIGKKIEEAVKKMNYKVQGSFQHMADKPSYEETSALATQLMDLFASKEIDKVELIYHHFKSVSSHALISTDYLPIDLTVNKADANDKKAQKKIRIDYIIEPSLEEFITELLPKVLCLQIFTALLDSNASEHAARMMAMQIATDNANELIQDLTKQYNKSRQQAITNELLDIIGGSMK